MYPVSGIVFIHEMCDTNIESTHFVFVSRSKIIRFGNLIDVYSYYILSGSKLCLSIFFFKIKCILPKTHDLSDYMLV